MKRNPVFEELRVKRLEQKRSAAEHHGDMVCSNVFLKDERKIKIVYHRHTEW